MNEQPKHRWLSRRTKWAVLAVLCLATGWLVWQIQIVRERKAVRQELMRLSPAGVDDWGLESLEARLALVGKPTDYDHLRVSKLRRLLGDETQLLFELPPTCEPKLIERIELAFPEAELHHYDADRREFSFRDSLYKPAANRQPNRGTAFQTGLK